MHTLMLFIMNWGYFIAALWVLGAVAMYEFVPDFPFKRDIVVAILVLAASHVWAAYIFHDGVAYERAQYQKAAEKETSRQETQLKEAQQEGAKAILNLEIEKAAAARLQKDYDKLSADFNTKQCLTPEQLRRIDQSGNGSASPNSPFDARDPHSADSALPSLRLPSTPARHRHKRRKR